MDISKKDYGGIERFEKRWHLRYIALCNFHYCICTWYIRCTMYSKHRVNNVCKCSRNVCIHVLNCVVYVGRTAQYSERTIRIYLSRLFINNMCPSWMQYWSGQREKGRERKRQRYTNANKINTISKYHARLGLFWYALLFASLGHCQIDRSISLSSRWRLTTKLVQSALQTCTSADMQICRFGRYADARTSIWSVVVNHTKFVTQHWICSRRQMMDV